MKIIKTITFFVLFSTYLFSQGSGKETAWFVELFLGFSNCPQPNSYIFYLDKVSTIWAANHDFIPSGFFINEDAEIDNSIYPWHVRNTATSNPGDWKGWNMVYSQDQTTINDTVVPVYGYGLYKISTNASNSHFYIDYRDDRIPYLNVTHIGHVVDHWVKYDFSNNKFYISPISHSSSYTEISNGDLIRFWELKETNPAIPSTLEFPDYWENCLALIPSINNHPKLVWGPYPQYISGAITGYNVYSANHVQGMPPENFSLLANLESDDFDYVDNTITIGSGINSRSYYVKCVFEDQTEKTGETEPTNTVEVNIENPSKRSVVFNSQKNNSYGLEQNYPNPFNPATIINYSIAENTFVVLKVYDVLGTEVAELVNSNKAPGNYSVSFDATGISSGLYLYQLKAGGYAITKKMLVTK